MSEESNANAPERAGETVGATLRKAREAAAIDINKICSDLRISPQALEALEQGNYHQLPGDPYIRALLGSLGRYLGIDPIALVGGYNKEIGAVHAAPSIAPYKDRASTHTAAHKQIFIAIFAVLIVVLILLINALKKGDSDSAGAPPAPAAAGSPADSLALPQDTLESKSLAPDSGQAITSPDSGETKATGAARPTDSPRAAKAAGASAIPVPSAVPTPAGLPAADPAGGLNSAIVKPLIDSVGVKVVRSGKEDFGTVLRLGKQMAVSHTDTIVIMISKRRAVEVTLGGKTVIPERKRFKIFGTTLKTF